MKTIYKYLMILTVIAIMITTNSFAIQETYNVNGVNKKMYTANIKFEGISFLGNSGVTPLLIDDRMYIAATDLTYMDTKVTVGWDSETESVLINSSKGQISYKKGGTGYVINGESRELGGNTTFYIVNSKSMIPVSILPTFADLGVSYDAVNDLTNITKAFNVADDLFEQNTNSGNTSSNLNQSDNTILTVTKNNSTETINIFTGFDSTYQTMFLTDPNRFVVDIYGYNGNILEVGNITDSNFVSSVAYYYHDNEQKYRITFTLISGTTTSNIKTVGTSQGINIEYTASAKTFSYTSDRVNSQLVLSLDKGILLSDPVYNAADNTLTVVIPFSMVALNTGEVLYSDRNVEKINTILSNQNYISTIYLKSRVSYTVNDNGSNGSLNIKFTKNNSTTPTIVIDAGHGGKDNGASNQNVGITEKQLNLTSSTNIAALLRAQGYNVIETRNNDTFVELKERAAIANSLDADLFISIHQNSAVTTSAKGIETLYYPTSDNKTFASLVQKHLIAATGANNRGVVERPNLVVLNSTSMPAVLLELGFISNSDEVSLLMDLSYQNKMAEAVVKAVNEYFGR